MGTMIAELDDPTHAPPLRMELRFVDVRPFKWSSLQDATNWTLEVFDVSEWGWESAYLVAGWGAAFLCQEIEAVSISPVDSLVGFA